MSRADPGLSTRRNVNAIFAATSRPKEGPALLKDADQRRGTKAGAPAAIVVNPRTDDRLRQGIDIRTGKPFPFGEPAPRKS